MLYELMPSPSLDFPVNPSSHNSEAILAQGKKLKFSELDLYDLELIPSVSDKLGISILEKRAQILQGCARQTHFEKKHKKCPDSLFELVKGVGPKKAQILEDYLLIE